MKKYSSILALVAMLALIATSCNLQVNSSNGSQPGPIPQGQQPGLVPQGPLPPTPQDQVQPVPGCPQPGPGCPQPGPIPQDQPQPQPPNPQPPAPTTDSGSSGSSGSGCTGAPVIPYFNASSTSITAGQSVFLSWGNVTNGNTGPLVASVTIQPGLGEVGSGASSRTVKPSTTTTYTLTATGCGGTKTQQVTVTVGPSGSKIVTVIPLTLSDFQPTDLQLDGAYHVHIYIVLNGNTNGNVSFATTCTAKWTLTKGGTQTNLGSSTGNATYAFTPYEKRWIDTGIKVTNKGPGYYSFTCTVTPNIVESNTGNNSVTKTVTVSP